MEGEVEKWRGRRKVKNEGNGVRSENGVGELGTRTGVGDNKEI